MLVLGIHGGLDLAYQDRIADFWHDSAAALVEDGRIVVAIEEERLNRIKHTGQFPSQAIEYCLKTRGVQLKDIDLVAVDWTETWANQMLFETFLGSDRSLAEMGPTAEVFDCRRLVAQNFRTLFGTDVQEILRFIPHHIAHAQSAYAFSGYEECLVAVFDAVGDTSSGLIGRGTKGQIVRLSDIGRQRSLGTFYLTVIRYIGFSYHEEYKVMGLAPYGDPSRFRSLFNQFYKLHENGEYDFALGPPTLEMQAEMGHPRKKDQPIEQNHIDIAAALQEALECVLLHVLRHARQSSELDRICLSGGVAQNCSMNGVIARSGLFRSVFVPPATYDAGNAIGAAVQAYRDAAGTFSPRTLNGVYWGSDITREGASDVLAAWGDLVSAREVQHVQQEAAKLLAEGHVIGWVQGRSEFGARALGNRSILADPRPPENKNRINAMVKKREAFRPFAPSVLAESVKDFFDLPEGIESLPYMTVVVKVKEDKRPLLGATTHVDGTARIQTVSKSDNERYWGLIREFGEITGIPVLLNTSFNNNVEPIVESIEDAIVCFVTTGLDYLVVNDFIVSKRSFDDTIMLAMAPSLPVNIMARHVISIRSNDRYLLSRSTSASHRPEEAQISAIAFKTLSWANGKRSLSACLRHAKVTSSRQAETLRELATLWANRWLRFQPT